MYCECGPTIRKWANPGFLDWYRDRGWAGQQAKLLQARSGKTAPDKALHRKRPPAHHQTAWAFGLAKAFKLITPSHQS